jgi:hypothetical protein
VVVGGDAKVWRGPFCGGVEGVPRSRPLINLSKRLFENTSRLLPLTWYLIHAVHNVGELPAAASHVPVIVRPAAEIKTGRSAQVVCPEDGALQVPLWPPARHTADRCFLCRRRSATVTAGARLAGAFRVGRQWRRTEVRCLSCLKQAEEQLVPPGGDGLQLRGCEALTFLNSWGCGCRSIGTNDFCIPFITFRRSSLYFLRKLKPPWRNK